MADRSRKPSPPDQACYSAHQHFIGACHAYREMLELYPSVEALDKESIGKAVAGATEHLTPRQRKEANRLVIQLFADRAKSLERNPEEAQSPSEEAVTAEIDAATPDVEKRAGDRTGATDIAVAQAVSTVAATIFLRSHRPPLPRVMLNGILTELVAALELLIGRLYAAFLLAYPDAIGPEKLFNLAELRTFNHVDEAIQYAIDARVDEFMMQSMADWKTWFTKYPKIDVDDLIPDAGTLTEIQARRNVIVHNDGVVSRRYRALVGSKGPELGTRLRTGEEYVSVAIDHVLVFGATLGAATWQKIAPDGDGPKMANRHLHALDMSLMLLGRWKAVGWIADIALRRLAVDESDRLVYQVNSLLSRKRLNGVESILDDVGRLDVSAAGAQFQVARAALLDRYEEVAQRIPVALASQSMTVTDVHSWPLLMEFRTTEHYSTLFTPAKKSKAGTRSTLPAKKPTARLN